MRMGQFVYEYKSDGYYSKNVMDKTNEFYEGINQVFVCLSQNYQQTHFDAAQPFIIHK